MRIPRVNIYLPEPLAAQVRPLGLNLSSLLQGALAERLGAVRATAWLEQVSILGPAGPDHRGALRALDAARGDSRG